MGVGTTALTVPSPDAATTEYDSLPGLVRQPFDPLKPLDPAQMQKILEEGDKEKAKAALVEIEKAKKALEDAKAFLSGLSTDKLYKMGYAKLVAEVRKNFPEAANLAVMAKEYARLPGLGSKLPKKDDLLNMVKGVIKDKGLDFGMSKLDPVAAAKELLLAGYMAEMPSGVEVDIVGAVVQLNIKGAALSVATPAGKVDAKVDKAGAEISLKANDYSIEVNNEGLKDFDPKLRAKWQSITDEAKQVAELEASTKEAKIK